MHVTHRMVDPLVQTVILPLCASMPMLNASVNANLQLLGHVPDTFLSSKVAAGPTKDMHRMSQVTNERISGKLRVWPWGALKARSMASISATDCTSCFAPFHRPARPLTSSQLNPILAAGVQGRGKPECSALSRASLLQQHCVCSVLCFVQVSSARMEFLLH